MSMKEEREAVLDVVACLDQVADDLRQTRDLIDERLLSIERRRAELARRSESE